MIRSYSDISDTNFKLKGLFINAMETGKRMINPIDIDLR